MDTLPLINNFASNNPGIRPVDNLYQRNYALYSYVRDENGVAGSFIFNGKRLNSPNESLNNDFSGLWLYLLDDFMGDAEIEDRNIMIADTPLEYTREIIYQGKEYKFLISKLPFRTKDGHMFLTVSIRDVTVFLDSVNEIAVRKMLFSLVADNMSDVFVVIDMGAKPSFMSPSIKKLTGYSYAELFELPLTKLLKPASILELERIWEQYRLIAEKTDITIGEISPVHFELEFIRKDQEVRWAEVTSAIFPDNSGKMHGVHGLIRDITERKVEQESINNTLQHEIELSMVKSKYISTISHEFRTPLSIIYSNLQLLENHRFQLDEETISDAFELSRMAVKSLLRVLDKVTVIDAVKKNKLEFKPAFVDLADLCNRIVKDLNEMEMVPDRIDLVIGSIGKDVWIDDSLFSHIFTNLLHNALNFSDKKKRVKFEIRLVSPLKAEFVVKDEGIGIPEDEKQYIFESFYRASNSSNARGSGLGLAVVKECLILHKGDLSYESKVGSGSVFKVTLPITPDV